MVQYSDHISDYLVHAIYIDELHKRDNRIFSNGNTISYDMI